MADATHTFATVRARREPRLALPPQTADRVMLVVSLACAALTVVGCIAGAW